MSRRNRRGVMSEDFKYELAKDLGFYDTVKQEGWGGIRTKDAGNMVKRALQIAEQSMKQAQQPGTQMQGQARPVQQPVSSQVQQPVVMTLPPSPYAQPQSFIPQQGAGQAFGAQPFTGYGTTYRPTSAGQEGNPYRQ